MDIVAILLNPFLIIGLVLVVIVILSYMLKAKAEQEERRFLREMPIHFVGLPREKDTEADRIVKEVRDNIALNWLSAAPSSMEAFSGITNKLITDIAHVYYPDAKDPVKQVTVNALIGFYRRVSSRITLLLKTPPFTLIGKVDLRVMVTIKEGTDYVMNHPVTQTIMENPITGIIKKIPFLKMRKAVKIAKKIKTPMGMIFEAGKEITIEGAKRLFLSELLGIIAEEAIHVFSGRMVKNEKSKADLLSLFAMAQILRDQQGISASEHRVFLNHLAELKHLDEEFKLFLLAYAMKQEEMLGGTLEDLMGQARISVNLKKTASNQEELEKEQKLWRRFSELEDFTPVKDLKSGEEFLEALRPLIEADGAELEGKEKIWKRARLDLKSDFIN